MDWSKFKVAIGTIAPWIASTLGSPVAGIAVKAVCDVFGLSGDAATPDNALAALSGATGEQLQALRDAESKHVETMAQLGYTNIAQLFVSEVADRKSARDMQMATPSNWPGILSAITTGAVLAIIAASIAGHSIPQDTVTVQLIGSLTTGWGAAMAYWLGTTRGSSDKNNLIAQSQPAGEKI